MLILFAKIVLGISFLGIVIVGGRVLLRLRKKDKDYATQPDAIVKETTDEVKQISVEVAKESKKTGVAAVAFMNKAKQVVARGIGNVKRAVSNRSSAIHGGIMNKLDEIKDRRDKAIAHKQSGAEQEMARIEHEEKQRKKSVQKELIKPQVSHDKKAYFTSLLSSLGKEDGEEEATKIEPQSNPEPQVEPESMKIRVSSIGGGVSGIIGRRKKEKVDVHVRDENSQDAENSERMRQLLLQEERALIEAITKTPKDIRLYKRLGLVYKELGNTSDAQQCFREALKRGSQDPEVRRALAEARVGA